MTTAPSRRTIGEFWTIAEGRPAGFDNLRVILALSVILWHTVIVCYGFSAQTWFWTGPLRPVVFFIVPGFFALSGFLVAGSLLRNDLLSFASLRIIRIYPALAFEVLLSAFFIGAAVTSTSLKNYFYRKLFLYYLLNMFGWIHYHLPGVFLTNPFSGFVNLQLWTVPYELECYSLLIFLAVIGLHRKPKLFLSAVIILTAGEMLGSYIRHDVPVIDVNLPGQMPVLSFLFGVALFIIKDLIRISFWNFTAALVAYVVLIYNGYGIYASSPFVAYITICIGVQNKKLPLVDKLSNYSYGIYLYGFPMQQLIAYLLPDYRVWWINFILSVILTIGIAALSWHLVEKPIDKNKRLIIKRIADFRDNAVPYLRAVVR